MCFLLYGWTQEWVDQWATRNYHFLSKKKSIFCSLKWITKVFHWFLGYSFHLTHVRKNNWRTLFFSLFKSPHLMCFCWLWKFNKLNRYIFKLVFKPYMKYISIYLSNMVIKMTNTLQMFSKSSRICPRILAPTHMWGFNVDYNGGLKESLKV